MKVIHKFVVLVVLVVGQNVDDITMCSVVMTFFPTVF